MRIGVDEPAEGGRANAAAYAALAMALAITASRVAVILGQTSRDKTLRVAGDATTLAERLEKL